MRRRAITRAFTLVELLVVISIIALLIAILLPNLKKAREQAKRTACLSNMRSLALAVQTYAMNNNDALIGAGLAHGGTVDEHAAWINSLKTDYGNALVARCPADRSIFWHEPYGTTGQRRRASYATNYYTVGRIGSKGPHNRLGMIRRPAYTIHLVELAELGEYAVADHVHPESWYANPEVKVPQQMQLKRHLLRENYSFIDGHVDWSAFVSTYEVDKAASVFPLKIVYKHNLYDPEIAQ